MGSKIIGHARDIPTGETPDVPVGILAGGQNDAKFEHFTVVKTILTLMGYILLFSVALFLIFLSWFYESLMTIGSCTSASDKAPGFWEIVTMQMKLLFDHEMDETDRKCHEDAQRHLKKSMDDVVDEEFDKIQGSIDKLQKNIVDTVRSSFENKMAVLKDIVFSFLDKLRILKLISEEVKTFIKNKVDYLMIFFQVVVMNVFRHIVVFLGWLISLLANMLRMFMIFLIIIIVAPLPIPFVGLVLALVLLAVFISPILAILVVVIFLSFTVAKINEISQKSGTTELCTTNTTKEDCLYSVSLGGCVWLDADGEQKCVNRTCSGKGMEECKAMPLRYHCHWSETGENCVDASSTKSTSRRRQSTTSTSRRRQDFPPEGSDVTLGEVSGVDPNVPVNLPGKIKDKI